MRISRFGKGYTGSFKSTDLTDSLHKMLGVRFDCEYMTPEHVRKGVTKSKK